jgi:hypothetical protein
MLLQSLMTDNVIGLSRILAAMIVCGSWVSAFRLLQGPDRDQASALTLFAPGFCRF